MLLQNLSLPAILESFSSDLFNFTLKLFIVLLLSSFNTRIDTIIKFPFAAMHTTPRVDILGDYR
jgi:hypothetical protein